MNFIHRNIPNALTCLNILSGCVAIVFAFKASEPCGPWLGWQWASLAMGVAVAADFLDGLSARLLSAYSEFGKQLDSLCDLVSFGVAPAMLLMNILSADPGMEVWLPWTTLIVPVCGALRLARFNIDPNQSDTFVGLPIPANAIFWIGWGALYYAGFEFARSTWIVLIIIILEALMMVSSMRLFSLKFHNYGWQGNQKRWMLIVASVIMLTLLGLKAFCPIIIFYIFLAAVPARKS